MKEGDEGSAEANESQTAVVNHGAGVNEAGCIRERWAPDVEERERWRVNQREEWNEVKGRGGGMHRAA